MIGGDPSIALDFFGSELCIEVNVYKIKSMYMLSFYNYMSIELHIVHEHGAIKKCQPTTFVVVVVNNFEY